MSSSSASPTTRRSCNGRASPTAPRFFTAALPRRIWGRLADLYGRKLMLIRASLGMAVAMSLIGMAQNVWQLVALRLLAGIAGRLRLRLDRAGRDADAEEPARAGRWACCPPASWRATWPAR